MKPSSREDQNRKNRTHPLSTLCEDHTKGLQFFIARLKTRKDCPKNKNIANPSPWETVRNLSVFTLRNVLATEETKNTPVMREWPMHVAGESVITESSSPTMRQMGKKLTRNMLRDALSLSQNWNCGNKYKRGLYICEYSYYIHNIYIYTYIMYI